MKTFILTIIMALFVGSLIAQNLIRVNNSGFDADYNTLSTAIAGASNGDTIYVEGSASEYEGCSINKQITIIGPGYFLGENPQTQAVSLDAKFESDITFANGSSGSTIMGCHGVNLVINTNNISIIRNYFESITTGNTVSGINIMQNYINGPIYAADYQGSISNSVITNNYIGNHISMGSQSGGLIVTNNILHYGLSIYNSTIQNNIMVYGYNISENSGNSISYNLLATDGVNANNNQYNINMNDVFVDFSGSLDYSTDGKWQLSVNSPAIGAASGGEDCGIFGGMASYILSGVPNLPHIYEADIPAAVSSGSTLSISIKVKSGD
jgi:hypothetical protein